MRGSKPPDPASVSVLSALMSDADATLRASALAAALAEVQQWGVDRFSIEGAAQRGRLDPDYFRQNWASEHHLIVDALLDHSEGSVPVPDTGSLRGDLIALSLSVADSLNGSYGRRLLRMLVVDSRSQAVDSDTRGRYWSSRLRTIEVIFHRAAERGELHADVKPFVAIQLLLSPLHTVALYTDIPVDPDYCRAVADMVTRAVSP